MLFCSVVAAFLLSAAYTSAVLSVHDFQRIAREAPNATTDVTDGSTAPTCPHPSLALTNEWSGWGANAYNNRWASLNKQVSSSNIDSLALKCRLEYELAVSATPTVHGNIVYYPTWNGLLVALNYHTCEVLWQTNVSSIILDFAPITGATTVLRLVSRTSPQIDGNVLYIGTLAHALLVAVDKDTGDFLHSIQLNTHPVAILTMSPTVYKGKIFIGVSSLEELAVDVIPDYVCCSFAANMLALSFTKSAGFKILWDVGMLPDPQGDWSGAALWGGQPSIDVSRSQVFVATGNVYSAPAEFLLCQNQTANISVIAQGLTSDPCLPRNVYQESVIAFDMDLGVINWVNQLSPIDAWTLACGVAVLGIPRNTAECPYAPGPDADFGMAPTFVPGSSNTPYGKDMVVIGQKNGILWALSAQSGRVLWSTVTGPDGTGGGLIWGIAADNTQAYITAVNTNGGSWQLQPSGENISSSAFGAVALLDGSIKWEIPAAFESHALVPPSVVQDVAFFGRTVEYFWDANATVLEGGLVVIDKVTGEVLRDIPLDTEFHGGVAVQGKYVMFGTGYSGTVGNGSFYVMCV